MPSSECRACVRHQGDFCLGFQKHTFSDSIQVHHPYVVSRFCFAIHALRTQQDDRVQAEASSASFLYLAAQGNEEGHSAKQLFVCDFECGAPILLQHADACSAFGCTVASCPRGHRNTAPTLPITRLGVPVAFWRVSVLASTVFVSRNRVGCVGVCTYERVQPLTCPHTARRTCSVQDLVT